MPDFAALVAAELAKARESHKPLNSLHEGYAVLLEEVDELWDEVKKRASRRDVRLLLVELVQVAAMAQRIAEDTGLLTAVASLEAETKQLVDDCLTWLPGDAA